jgi:hypothetical protein
MYAMGVGELMLSYEDCLYWADHHLGDARSLYGDSHERALRMASVWAQLAQAAAIRGFAEVVKEKE